MLRSLLRLLLIIGPMSAGGCGSSFALLPPGIPDGPQLESYSQANFQSASRIADNPRDALVIGIAYVDQRCSDFFDAVEQMNRRNEVVAAGLASATSQAAIIMRVAERSALEVARVAGALEVTRAILSEYKEQFTFAPHSSQLRSLVIQAMTAQRMEYGKVVAADLEFSHVDAMAAVRKYAENCTLGAIREHWNNAVAKAVREGVQPDLPVANMGGASKRALVPESRPPANILGVNRYVVK